MQGLIAMFTPSRISKMKAAIIIGYYLLQEYLADKRVKKSDVSSFKKYARTHKPPPLAEINKTVNGLKRLQGQKSTNKDKELARKIFNSWKQIYETYNAVKSRARK